MNAASEIKTAHQLNIFNKILVNDNLEEFLSESEKTLENWYPFIKQ